MITMTHDQIEKIALIDKLFGSVDVRTLKEFAESEQVVAKLRGTDQNPELFMRLVREHDMLQLDLMNTRNELLSLKSDFQTLMKILNMTTFSYSSDWNNLKQKHNVY
jgi:hypothetical protein